jgi:hypothetical protein
MLQDLAPGAVFECDQARMLNVKVDTMPRFETGLNGEVIKDSNGNPVSTTFIYIEEPTQGYYDIPYRGHQRQRLPLMIYFCKFEPMGNDAYKGDTPFSAESKTTSRLILRDELERTLVRPFLLRLKTSRLGMLYPEMMNTVRIVYPSARFDANEVSVGIELTTYSDWCIWSEDPGMDLIGKRLIDLPVGTDLSGRMIRCLVPDNTFPAALDVPSYADWIFDKASRLLTIVRTAGGANDYAYLEFNIRDRVGSGWISLYYTALRSNTGDRNLWYNPVLTIKAPKGSTVLTPAPEIFKQYPFNTLTIVG